MIKAKQKAAGRIVNAEGEDEEDAERPLELKKKKGNDDVAMVGGELINQRANRGGNLL